MHWLAQDVKKSKTSPLKFIMYRISSKYASCAIYLRAGLFEEIRYIVCASYMKLRNGNVTVREELHHRTKIYFMFSSIYISKRWNQSTVRFVWIWGECVFDILTICKILF